MQNGKVIEDLSFVLASKKRHKIIIGLNNYFLTPSMIADRLDLRIYDVSKVLYDLKLKKLVECINPQEKKGRLYKLTTDGMEILKILNKYQ